MGQRQGEKITGSNPVVVAGIDVGSLQLKQCF